MKYVTSQFCETKTILQITLFERGQITNINRIWFLSCFQQCVDSINNQCSRDALRSRPPTQSTNNGTRHTSCISNSTILHVHYSKILVNKYLVQSVQEWPKLLKTEPCMYSICQIYHQTYLMYAWLYICTCSTST